MAFKKQMYSYDLTVWSFKRFMLNLLVYFVYFTYQDDILQ